MSRAFPLALLVALGLMLVVAVSTARPQTIDPGSGGQPVCTWALQGYYIPHNWGYSWADNVYAFRWGTHLCWTRYGTPAWLYAGAF